MQHQTLFLLSLVAGSGGASHGSRPVVTTPVPASLGAVGFFRISPDGAHVVYDHFSGSSWSLHTVPIDGSGPVLTIDSVEPVAHFHMTANGAPLAYLSPGCVQTVRTAPVDGSASPVDIGTFYNECDGDMPWRVSSDGQWIAFKQDDYGIYSAPSDGSGPVVALSLPSSTYVRYFLHDPGSTHVYFTQATGGGRFALYRTAVDGSGAMQLLSFPPAVGLEGADMPVLSPDGSRVVYRGEEDTDGIDELYSVPADGSTAPIKLNPTLVAGGNVASFPTFAVSPDSQQVLYLADQDVDQVVELYGVPAAGGPSVRLSRLPNATRSVTAFQITPDSGRVLYRSDQRLDEVYELFVARSDGLGNPARLNPRMPAQGDVGAFRLGPDGRWLAYTADQRSDGENELFALPMPRDPKLRRGERQIFRLNGPLAPGGDVGDDFLFTADGTRVVFRALAPNGETELYSAAVDGSGAPLLLSGDPPAGADVVRFDLGPSGSAVFMSTSGTHHDLWSIPVDAGSAAVLLNPGQS